MTAHVTIKPGTRNHALTLVGSGTRETIPFREQGRLHRTVQAMARAGAVDRVVYREP